MKFYDLLSNATGCTDGYDHQHRTRQLDEMKCLDDLITETRADDNGWIVADVGKHAARLFQELAELLVEARKE